MPAQTFADLPLWHASRPSGDWLLGNVRQSSVLARTSHPNEFVLSNGLVARVFRLSPNAATVGLQNLMTGQEMLRAVKPEATIEVDGKRWQVGGLTGQPDLGYLRSDWLDAMKSDPDCFQFDRLETGPIRPRLDWKRSRPSPKSSWPPKGVELTLWFHAPKGGPDGLQVGVHYEIYDGLPLLGKSLTVVNRGTKPIRLGSFTSERLGLVEAESIVDATSAWRLPNMTVTTDYTFGGMAQNDLNRTTYWLPDPNYDTQVNYELKTPCMLEVRPPLGPDVELPPGGSFNSFHTFELIHDSTDRERQGMAVRKMFRALAPWCAENPLMMHITSSDPATVRHAIDQMADCGFELAILSFGSGLDMEDVSPGNIAKFKALADYAHSKGIQIGGYSLLASRRIDDADDVISPKTGKPDDGAVFGASPCLGSAWGRQYFDHLRTFLDRTGFDMLEHDGSYPGDVCASTSHPGHHGLQDSQWTQFQTIADFYRWCRSRGIFLNVPDDYFLEGSNKTGMGYRETNWSLPRDQQHVHARQNLYDGTWEKTPSMGWMFVPLVEYHGGGAAATIEPLKEHLADYRAHLMNNLGYGAQACYRGPRLYDSPETEQMVRSCVDWFKRYRDILESDVVHVRRADGRNLDCIVHVNPSLPIRALAMVYNPTDEPLTQEIEAPMYYAGLKARCHVAEQDGTARAIRLNDKQCAILEVTVPAHSCRWYVVRP